MIMSHGKLIDDVSVGESIPMEEVLIKKDDEKNWLEPTNLMHVLKL